MAFRIIDKSLKFDVALYPKVERKLATVGDKGWDKVGGFTLRDKETYGVYADFMPQPGLQENLCSCEANLIFICGAATSGKAQPYDAKVLTPNGFVEMGSLKVGDTITGSEGKPQKVLKIFEQGVRNICQIDFADGGWVECDYNHLWAITATFTKKKKQEMVVDTRTLIGMMNARDGGYGCVRNIYMPLVGAVEYNQPNDDLPINPYVLGVIIGDGCTRTKTSKPRISTPDIEIIDKIISIGYEMRQLPSDAMEWQFEDRDIIEKLKELGLWDCLSYDKFIPKQYLTSSIENRMELLRGLMDTDGSASGHSSAEFSTSSVRLANDVRELVFSLGGYCNTISRIPKYTYNGELRNGHLSHRLYVSFQNQSEIFHIRKKKDRCKTQRNPNYLNGRRVEKISDAGKKQCRCILVSNPDHLYVTDDFIVTHNTYAMYLKSLYGITHPGFTATLFSYREKDSQKGSSIFRDGVEVLGNFANCDYVSSGNIGFRYPQYNSQLQLANFNYNVDNPSDWSDFKEDMKKRQSSLNMIDECTKMKEKAFLYLFSRNRDSSGMTPQTIASFNPEYEHFTCEVLNDAGYMEQVGNSLAVRKDMEGKIRYFFLKGKTFKTAVWGDTPEEVIKAAGITITDEERAAGMTEASLCKSFTVFTGEAAGNRKLIAATGGQSVANLSASGDADVLRSGLFTPRDENVNNVTRAMIHALWGNPVGDDLNMYATFDVGGGKGDSAPMIIWRGLQMIAIEYFTGESQGLSAWIQSQLSKYGVSVEHFAYDGTGFGYFLQALTSGISITANRRVLQEYDEHGNPVTVDEFFNCRSQLLGKLEVALKRGDISCVIDKNKPVKFGTKNETRRFIDVLYDGVNLFITTKKNGKTYYNSKEEFKARFKYSPGELDAMSLRMVFELDTRERKQPKPQVADDAYDALWQNYGGRRLGKGYW